MKKIITLLLCIALFTAFLTACGGQAEPSAAPPPAPAAEASGAPIADAAEVPVISSQAPESPAPMLSLPEAADLNIDIGVANDFLSSDGKIFDMLGYLESLENVKYLSSGGDGFVGKTITIDEWDVIAADGYWSIVITYLGDGYGPYDLGAHYEVPYTFVGADGSELNGYLDAFSVGLPLREVEASGDIIEFEYEIEYDYRDENGDMRFRIAPGSKRMQLEKNEFYTLITMLQRINDNPTLAFDPLSGFEHNIVFTASNTEKGANLSGYGVSQEGTAEEQFYYYGIVDTEDIFSQINILRYERWE